MKCYLDTSALIKRTVDELETASLKSFLVMLQAQGVPLLTSVISEIEVARTIRRAVAAGRINASHREIDQSVALDGVDIIGLDPVIVSEARVIGDDKLRSLDAVHLATARMAGAHVVVTYDERMIKCAADAGVMTARPGYSVDDVTLPPGWAWL